MIKDTMFVIAVPNLAQSSNFYEQIMGFSIHEVGDPGWRIYRKDKCTIMAGECPDAIPPSQLGDHSYFCYLIVENARDYYAQIKAFEVEIVKEIRDEPWGMREFGLRTADGHRIMVGQNI